MKKRLVHIDILRIIGILSIISLDVLKEFVGYTIENNNHVFTNTLILFLRFSIPIFFMITGTLVLSRTNENKLKIIKYRVIKLFIPLLSWSLIYNYFKISRTLKESFHFLSFLKITFIGIIEGTSFSHFWFIYVILAIYTISPFIAKMLQSSEKKEIEYLLLLWLFANVFYTTFQITYKQLSHKQVEIAFFNIPLILNYTGYFILGYYLEKYKIKVKNSKLILSLLFSFCFLLSLEIIFGSTNEHMNTYLTFTTFISSTSIYLLIKRGKYNMVKDTNLILLKSFSKSAMGVYFIHLIILLKLKDVLLIFTNPFIYICINIILVYLISYTIVKLSNLDKRLSYILGT